MKIKTGVGASASVFASDVRRIMNARKLNVRVILAAVVCTTIASTAMAQLGESERTLNLKDLQPLFTHASGKRLLLGVATNQVCVFLTVINPAGTLLKKREPSQREPKVQILLGKDVLGFAEVSLNSMPAGRKVSKIKSVDFVLTFETDQQAAKTAEALRLPAVTPQPIQSRKNHK